MLWTMPYGDRCLRRSAPGERRPSRLRRSHQERGNHLEQGGGLRRERGGHLGQGGGVRREAAQRAYALVP